MAVNIAKMRGDDSPKMKASYKAATELMSAGFPSPSSQIKHPEGEATHAI